MIALWRVVAALARPAATTDALYLRAVHRRCCRSGFVAVIAGWTVTEVGRQPWVVYGLLRTRDAVIAVAHRRATSLLSLALYVVVYLIVFGARHLLHGAPRARGPAGRSVRSCASRSSASVPRGRCRARDADA